MKLTLLIGYTVYLAISAFIVWCACAIAARPIPESRLRPRRRHRTSTFVRRNLNHEKL